ncbi:MAG: isoleucine--tRNA ligase [Legionella sp.]|nr:MAG: isoleucine--tRNA ligase [Legionella sp.]PJD99394.1 MAG: isoleucine--tRNA ligase [Legionella sp.]
MAEYKDTLNLPNTSFPMKASLAMREPQMLAYWQEQEVYQQIRKAHAGKKKFILHDGPPYANGHLHCGHALNKILKDMIIKSKSFSGFDAPFIPGWDCHGLPIELNVEKKIGKAGVKVTAKEFRAQCRSYAASQIDIQRTEFQRLGVLGDWYNPYVTMDYKYEADVVRSLGLMLKNGHLQQGFKPVHWCIDCGSALAEAEVDYEEKTSPSIDVAFSVKEIHQVLELFHGVNELKPVIVPIWTTTPWTLPANEAVCLHPEINYALVQTPTAYFILAADLVATAMQRYAITEYVLCGELKGQALEHTLLQHPFYDKQVPLVLGMHVTTESGTGCVHTAPAHGPDDYQVGLAYNLPLTNPVKANGCYTDEVALFAGLSVLKANEPVLNQLEAQGTLLAKENLRHSYPHCWRHKSPMIFLATPQWFISMDKNHLRQQIANEIDAVNWVPDWGRVRIKNMIESRPDWCISRQRAWGTPMPLFIHSTTKALHPDSIDFIEKIAVLIEHSGIDAWFDLDKDEFLGPDAPYYEKVLDTMDVWLDSGVSHYSVLKQKNELHFPADVYFEGSDQHRGWFNSSLTTSVAMYGTAPYTNVLTHGFTVDAEGKKLSKSKGNYVALDKLIAQYGADILRLWVSSTDYRYEVSISDEILKRNADAYRRIRNTARFLLANLDGFDPEKDAVDATEFVELDRFALTRCKELQEELIAAYEQYHFHIIYQKIHNFCAVDMGSFYLDLVKDRQYTSGKYSVARRSCQTAMYHILKAFTLWIAPILSFTAEEIWSYIPGNKKDQSVFTQTWYSQWPAYDAVNMTDWATLHTIRDEVNKSMEEKRQSGVIGSALAAEVVLYASPQVMPQLTRLNQELRFLLITSEATVQPIASASADLTLKECGVAIEVRASTHEKCARCWHRRPDVGQDRVHPELCVRCLTSINGQDEERLYI